MSMYCSQCGNKLNDDQRFCDKCGAKNQSFVLNEPVSEAPENKGPIDEQEKRTVLSSKVIAIICLLVVLIPTTIAVFAITATSGDNKRSDYSSQTTDGYTYRTTTYKYTMSSSQIESTVASALLLQLYKETNTYGVKISESCNISDTTYNIASTVEQGSGYLVRGTFTLYDYYGRIKYYNCTFNVRIYEYGTSDCSVSIK